MIKMKYKKVLLVIPPNNSISKEYLPSLATIRDFKDKSLARISIFQEETSFPNILKMVMATE